MASPKLERRGGRSLDGGKPAERQPAGERPYEHPGPLEPNEPGAHRIAKAHVPHPDLRQRGQIRIDDEVHRVARLLEAGGAGRRRSRRACVLNIHGLITLGAGRP